MLVQLSFVDAAKISHLSFFCCSPSVQCLNFSCLLQGTSTQGLDWEILNHGSCSMQDLLQDCTDTPTVLVP